MGSSCCENKSSALEKMRENQSRILLLVLIVNLVMFVVELVFGLIANSTALLADALDMFGDATVYAFSLYVVTKNVSAKAKAATLKAVIMILFGVGVFIEAAYKGFSDITPIAQTMGMIGIVALGANTYCLWVLSRHKNDDINMRSVWICSRNDIIANLSILGAAVLVNYFQSKWPDIIVGISIATLFISSGISVFKDARKELATAQHSLI